MSSHNSKDTKPSVQSANKRKPHVGNSSPEKGNPAVKKQKPLLSAAADAKDAKSDTKQKPVSANANDGGDDNYDERARETGDSVRAEFQLGGPESDEESGFNPRVVFTVATSDRTVKDVRLVSSAADLRTTLQTFILGGTPDDNNELDLAIKNQSIGELVSTISNWDTRQSELIGFTDEVGGGYLDAHAAYAVITYSLKTNASGACVVDLDTSVPTCPTIHKKKQYAELQAVHEIVYDAAHNWNDVELKDGDEQFFEKFPTLGRMLKKSVDYKKATELVDKYQTAPGACIVRVAEIDRS